MARIWRRWGVEATASLTPSAMRRIHVTSLGRSDAAATAGRCATERRTKKIAIAVQVDLRVYRPAPRLCWLIFDLLAKENMKLICWSFILFLNLRHRDGGGKHTRPLDANCIEKDLGCRGRIIACTYAVIAVTHARIARTVARGGQAQAKNYD